jgi:Na+/glutamate symporter
MPILPLAISTNDMQIIFFPICIGKKIKANLIKMRPQGHIPVFLIVLTAGVILHIIASMFESRNVQTSG